MYLTAESLYIFYQLLAFPQKFICTSSINLYVFSPHFSRYKRVIELGSGYGLAGLVIAAITEASEVVISDGNPQVVDCILYLFTFDDGGILTHRLVNCTLLVQSCQVMVWGKSMYIISCDSICRMMSCYCLSKSRDNILDGGIKQRTWEGDKGQKILVRHMGGFLSFTNWEVWMVA